MTYKICNALTILTVIIVSSSVLAEIDFNSYTILSYGGIQDETGTAVVEDGGATLHLTGNVWKCIGYPYTITPDTVLEFDLQSNVQGEEHAIGMDTDLTIQQGNRFKLYGTQSDSGTSIIVDFKNYASYAPNTHHYVIPIGQYYTGSMQYLFFSNDHDLVDPPMAESVYSNVLIHDPGSPPQPAGNSQPADSATDVPVYPELSLSWTSGYGAVSHNVYFGMDHDNVMNADTGSVEYYKGNQTENTFYPQSPACDAIYYWRIDEVNEYGVTAGTVWSFTTSDAIHLSLDDFESYYGNSRYAAVPVSGYGLLMQNWQDGATNGSGAAILDLQEGCLEFSFDNSASPYYSEVERTFVSPTDLQTSENFRYVSMWYKGSAAASGLYLRLYDNNGADETLHITDTAVCQSSYWQEVLFDLRPLSGVDLTAIIKIVIGVAEETPSPLAETGAVCIDDIKMYRCRDVAAFRSPADVNGDCAVDLGDVAMLASYWLMLGYDVNAAAPSGAPVAHYAMNDGTGSATVSDSINSYDGTLIPTSETTTVWSDAGGYEGGCLVFDGTFSVQLPSGVFSTVTGDLSVSVWLYSNTQGGPCDIDPIQMSVDTSTWQSLVWDNSDPDRGDYVDTWNHFAFVKVSAQGLLKIYKNGFLVSRADVSSDPIQAAGISLIGLEVGGEEYHSGKMDEMCVYDYALTQEEILYLAADAGAGIHQPAKPVFVPFDPYEDGRIDLSDFAVIAEAWNPLGL